MRDAYCGTCGHGYGVHEQVRHPLRIVDGIVEFYESQQDAPEACTGYPDQMGECRCRAFKDGGDDGGKKWTRTMPDPYND